MFTFVNSEKYPGYKPDFTLLVKSIIFYYYVSDNSSLDNFATG